MVEAVVGPCFASSSQYDPRRLNHRTVVSGVSALGQTDFDSCQRHFRFTPNSGHSSIGMSKNCQKQTWCARFTSPLLNLAVP